MNVNINGYNVIIPDNIDLKYYNYILEVKFKDIGAMSSFENMMRENRRGDLLIEEHLLGSAYDRKRLQCVFIKKHETDESSLYLEIRNPWSSEGYNSPKLLTYKFR